MRRAKRLVFDPVQSMHVKTVCELSFRKLIWLSTLNERTLSFGIISPTFFNLYCLSICWDLMKIKFLKMLADLRYKVAPPFSVSPIDITWDERDCMFSNRKLKNQIFFVVFASFIETFGWWVNRRYETGNSWMPSVTWGVSKWPLIYIISSLCDKVRCDAVNSHADQRS